MQLRTVPSSLIIAGGLALAAIVAGCGGGGSHGSALAPSATINVPGSAKSGTTVTLHFAGTRSLDSLGKRTAQYVSGKTMGVYISGTCITGGGTVTQSCTGASFPATYADVSSSSPLCTTSNGGGQTCTIAVNPAPGFSYQLKVVAVDAKPSPEASGYGSAIPATANVLSVGAIPAPVFSTPPTPAPSPTPTALGFFVPNGGSSTINVTLNPVAEQFVRVNEYDYVALTATDNVITESAFGPTSPSGSFSLAFAAGDAAGNLISAPACVSTYGGNLTSTNFPTQISGPPAGTCDNFGGPDGKQYAIELTSSIPTHICSWTGTGTSTPPPCGSAATSPNAYSPYDSVGLVYWNGSWQQEPGGMLLTGFTWDNGADDDTCSGTTPKCGVPIPLALTNNIPATATAGVGKSTSYTYTNASQFVLAPFVTTVSCGTNAGCATSYSCGPNTGTCPNIAISNGGTATITSYLYASGTVSALTAGTGCYANVTLGGEATWCMGVTTTTPPLGQVNNSTCYTGNNPSNGAYLSPIYCSAVPDPSAGLPTSAGSAQLGAAVTPAYGQTGTVTLATGSFANTPSVGETLSIVNVGLGESSPVFTITGVSANGASLTGTWGTAGYTIAFPVGSLVNFSTVALPAGTIDCTVSPSYTGPTTSPFLQIGQTVAYLEPQSFTKGSTTAPGTADAVTYKVVGVSSGVGYCSLQFQDTGRILAEGLANPGYYAPTVGIEVSSSNTVIPIPSPVPFP